MGLDNFKPFQLKIYVDELFESRLCKKSKGEIMSQQISIDEIIKKPQVDFEQLEKGKKLSEELRNNGFLSWENSLVPPFSRKRVKITDNSFLDLII